MAGAGLKQAGRSGIEEVKDALTPGSRQPGEEEPARPIPSISAAPESSKGPDPA